MTNTRRAFTDEFKREAVSLLTSSGRPLTQIASELGIQPSLLRSWRGLLNRTGQAFAGPGAASTAAGFSAEQIEIRRLRRSSNVRRWSVGTWCLDAKEEIQAGGPRKSFGAR